MTTGSWFVAFGSSELEEALENAEETLREAYVIPAAVKLQDSNPFVPTFIWRRDRPKSGQQRAAEALQHQGGMVEPKNCSRLIFEHTN